MNDNNPTGDKEAADRAPHSDIAMAASLTTSMTQWAASGFKTVEQGRHDARVAMCAQCKYHQAPLCTVCGCYTDKKAWLPHEDCPLGKWPG